jgi:hypothetical protein
MGRRTYELSSRMAPVRLGSRPEGSRRSAPVLGRCNVITTADSQIFECMPELNVAVAGTATLRDSSVRTVAFSTATFRFYEIVQPLFPLPAGEGQGEGDSVAPPMTSQFSKILRSQNICPFPLLRA